MSDTLNEIDDEELRRKRRAERLARMREEKKRQEKINKIARMCFLYGGCVLGAIVLVMAGTLLFGGKSRATLPEDEAAQIAGQNEGEEPQEGQIEILKDGGALRYLLRNGALSDLTTNVENENEEDTGFMPVAAAPVVVDGRVQVGDVQFLADFEAKTTSSTVAVGDPLIGSTNAVLINESTNEIVAQKDARTILNPASMTKILTILVAAEHITDLDDEVTITIEMTDFAYVNGCSTVGFAVGEVVTVRDLFYGTILPSGGDAAIALATYVAGSHEAFVELMNEKLEELGLSDTAHFTNCVGLYDKDHYCTAYDMAMILKAAVEDDWCREVLSLHTYTTSPTPEHPEGISISNWFLRRIEDKDTGGEVLCGKTGFVNQSRSCAASYFISEDGVPYICVTAGAQSPWKCIGDHVALYSQYGE
ncbi:MAG: D-alanyl-D-alanine carboxypeptidase [Acetatifactor sp.]|nr:D-alanyl-D-alanine carboxypeptidase [Acetatifactor sp.]